MEILTSNGVVKLGHRPGITFIEKFGRNATVASGTAEDVWDGGGIYLFPTIASKLDIVSTSAEDGAGTLTGALSITISGLDENFDPVSETVTLTGLATAQSENTYMRVYRVAVRTSGSAGTNVGIITLDSQSEVLEFARISAGKGQTNMALYTVPRGKKGYLKRWYVSMLRATGVTSTALDIDIFRREFGEAWKSTQPMGIQNDGAGVHAYDFYAPIEFGEKSDLVVNVIPSANADVTAGFTMILTNK